MIEFLMNNIWILFWISIILEVMAIVLFVKSMNSDQFSIPVMPFIFTLMAFVSMILVAIGGIAHLCYYFA